MKFRQAIHGWTALVMLAAAGSAVAQDTPKTDKPAGDDGGMMATMMEMSKIGDNHKLLGQMAGDWKYKVKWFVSPASPPMEFDGTSTTKPVMNGRYYVSEVTGKMSMPGPDGKMMDTEFKGMSTDGYDNAKKKFVGSWIDNMGTGIMSMEGTYDDATKTFTYTGEETPMPGATMKMRETVKLIDKDHYMSEFFENRGGAYVKTMEINYSR